MEIYLIPHQYSSSEVVLDALIVWNDGQIPTRSFLKSGFETGCSGRMQTVPDFIHLPADWKMQPVTAPACHSQQRLIMHNFKSLYISNR